MSTKRRRAVVAAALTAALAAGMLAAVAAPAGTAYAVSNTPATGADVVGPGCGASGIGVFLASGSTPSTVNSGDCTGHNRYGDSSSPTCTKANDLR
jgi:hypothetical protein